MNFSINNYKDKFYKFSNEKALNLYKSLNINLYEEYKKITKDEEMQKNDYEKVYSVLAYYLYMILYDEINNIKSRYLNFKIKSIEFDNNINSILINLYETSNRKYTVSNIQKTLIDKIKEHKLEEKIQEVIKEEKLDTIKENKKENKKIVKPSKKSTKRRNTRRRMKSAFYGVDNNKDNINTFENIENYYLKANTNITVTVILNANFKSILVKDINISNMLLNAVLKLLI